MNRKGIVWLSILGFALFTVAAAFWTFPRVEKTLNKQAETLDSVNFLDNADLEWNGRNGYLTVPADISKDTAEAAAAEIEKIQGVRNVKIIYDEDRIVKEEKVIDETEPEEKVIEKTAGSFNLDWTAHDKNISGKLDEETAGNLKSIFDVSGLDIDEKFNLSPNVLVKLESIGADIFAELNEGSLEVDGDKIKITGTVSETGDINSINDKWGALEGVELDLVKLETKDEAEKVQDEIDALLELGNIEFEYASVNITEESEEIVEKIAEILNEHEDINIYIIGHTDANGQESSNLVLSKKRAEAVLEMLVEKGIDASRMTADGKGETVPIDTNDTEEGRQNNRRVEIIVREND